MAIWILYFMKRLFKSLAHFLLGSLLLTDWLRFTVYSGRESVVGYMWCEDLLPLMAFFFIFLVSFGEQEFFILIKMKRKTF